MRTVGSHVPRLYGTVSDAQQQLINDLGGLKKTAKFCNRQKSALQAYADHHKTDKSMPLHIVECLQNT